MQTVTQEQGFNWAQLFAKDAHVDRVLVPIDFSSSTTEILRCARALAEEFGTAIELLHVIPARLKHVKGAARTSLLRAMSDAARQELSKLLEVLWPGQVRATVVIREGPARDAILEEARVSNAQLIVLGAHGLKGLSRWLHRRALSQLVRRAPCPVVLVPEASVSPAKKMG